MSNRNNSESEISKQKETQDVHDILSPELEEVLQDLSPNQRAIILENIQTFIGPLPHPDILDSYEKVKPGITDEIIKMARQEQENRHLCDRLVLEGPIKATKRGQYLAFAIAVIFALASTVLGILGQTAVAITLGSGTLVSLVTVFITNRPSRQSER